MRANEFLTESYEFFDTIVDQIKAQVPAEEIWFHGSRATGTEHDESDWDILVIVPDNIVGDEYINVTRILQSIARRYENFDIQPARASNNIARIAREEGERID